MKPLIIKIKAKDSLATCLIADNSAVYTDTIIKEFNYNNVSQKSIVVRNICNESFTLQAQTVFTQNDNQGSSFSASIINTIIPANSTVNVPVYYNGIYKGMDFNPTYTFSINGSLITYKLEIQLNDTIGDIQDFEINLGNRIDYIFEPIDFTSHHTDIDNDLVLFVFFYGNVSSIRYNNQPYISNTIIPLTDVQLEKVKHIAPNTDIVSEINVDYGIKDSQGNLIT